MNSAVAQDKVQFLSGYYVGVEVGRQQNMYIEGFLKGYKEGLSYQNKKDERGMLDKPYIQKYPVPDISQEHADYQNGFRQGMQQKMDKDFRDGYDEGIERAYDL